MLPRSRGFAPSPASVARRNASRALGFLGCGIVAAAALGCGVGQSESPAADDVVHEAVRIVTDDSVALTGTLSLPAAPITVTGGSQRAITPPPQLAALILVGGSGPQDRDGARAELPGYRPLADIADAVTGAGIAVLRLDDRGAGESGGSASATTTSRAARDIAAALRWLRGHERVDGSNVGLAGHSEGGLVALMAAASDSAVRTLVLLATPSRSGREVARWQRAWVATRDVARFPPATRQRLLDEAEAAAELTARTDPWMGEWFALEPRHFASRVRGRVLLVHGERDRQVPVEHAAELAKTLRRAGVSVDVRRFPNVDHLLLVDRNGDPDSYVRLTDRRVSRDVLEAIVAWLTQRS